jgi:acyl carrier protein
MTDTSSSTSAENELRSVIDGVIHYDATSRRRQAMRNRSATSNLPESAPREQPPVETTAAVTAEAQSRSVKQNGAPAPVANAAEAATSIASPEPAAVENSKPRMSPEELDSFLINFVVEQTGYPEEIVELDADLEADLGIDSIKKAQLFGELSEHFDVTPDETLSLDDFPTLRHVKEYLSQEATYGSSSGSNSDAASTSPPPAALDAPLAAPASSPPSSVSASASPSPRSSAGAAIVASAAKEGNPANTGTSTKMSPEELDSFLINFVVEQTGYPEEIVELDADLEADLGIDSIKKAQLFGELSEHFEVTPDETLSLDDFPTLRHVKEYLLLHG